VVAIEDIGDENHAKMMMAVNALYATCVLNISA
jgi:hypothetical protein